jgi:sarcosine oxidase subunit alpha
MTGYRLPSSGATQGGAQIAFRFDGRRLAGRAGETLAAALLAAGERIVARSFKYHRPRGVYGFGLEEPNALVRCGEDPLALATRIRLADGLDAHPVNAAPSLRFDWREIHDWLSPLLPAGFYYKTFMGPAGAWPHWERAIRAAAGLARLDGSAPSWRRDTRHVHCDVLVVGAGPAGLAAARDLAASGARVVLADDGAAPGAANLDGMEAWIDGEPVADWARRATAEFDGAQACTRLADTLVLALHDHGFALAVQRDPADGMDARLWRIRAGRVILATGALERPALFAGNDRAGVMSLAAVRRYAERFAVACGRDLVVVANNSAAYGDVARLRRMGVAVSAIVDPRRRIPAGALDLAGRFGVAVLGGQSAIAAVGRTVEAVRVSSSGSAGRPRTLDCDVLAVSGGWTPLVHLHSQAGGRLDHDAALDAFLPRLDSRPVTSIGSCAGRMTLAAALADGKATARAIAAGLGRTVPAARIEDVIAPEDFDPDPAVLVEAPGAAVAGKVFVDLAADVTTADIRLAAREGYDSVELMKRYTTAGMAGDQGRHGNLDAIAVLAQARGDLPGSVGTTTYRPPFAPVEFGTIAPRAGWFLAPARATPLTPWHEAAGAVMYDVGANWRRPGYYPRPGETLETATARECVACRTGVAIYDSSPLGKFEFGGRDVTTFLERLYCNAWADLPPGMGRYGMMLFEDGRVFDDGIAFRLSARRFLVTTTTGNADTALARFEYHRQIVWPELDVRIVPVTAQWADIVVCGPKAREVIAAAGTDIDLSSEAFAFMGLRTGRVAGIDARVMRVSFTGELSYEINVPARRALDLWTALMHAGAAHDIVPLGSEANHVLRIEKGFISVGHEADGVVDPYDLGMGWIVATGKPDFVGRQALLRNRADPAPRVQLVGLLAADPAAVPAEGAVVLAEDGRWGRGHVTASCMSPTLGRSLALALVEDGRRLIGTRVRLFAPSGSESEAEVVKPVFFDPRGERMRA